MSTDGNGAGERGYKNVARAHGVTVAVRGFRGGEHLPLMRGRGGRPGADKVEKSRGGVTWNDGTGEVKGLSSGSTTRKGNGNIYK